MISKRYNVLNEEISVTVKSENDDKGTSGSEIESDVIKSFTSAIL